MKYAAATLLALLPAAVSAQTRGSPHFHSITLDAGITSPVLAKNVVADCGADPTDITDSAPAFRACLASNTKLFVPPGAYLFASAQTPPCCFFDNAAVLVQSLSNVSIDGYGATITIAPSIALSSAFHFDKDSHVSIRGLTIAGNRTGLTSGQENAAISLSSDVDFQVEDIRATGYGGNGAAIDGDWLVDGTFSRLQMDGVGHCFDMAYLDHVSISHVRALGADTNGNHGAGQIGQTCFSVIVDVPNASQNNSGVAFTETNDVSVSGLEESNFSTGGWITTGTRYRFAGNDWHDNPGISPNPGLGLWIDYDAVTSPGVPPRDIVISDQFANNGAAVAGEGLMISVGGITNSDAIANLAIVGSQFYNNAAAGISSDSPTALKLPNLTIVGSTFSGAAQTTSVASSLLSAMGPPHPYYNGASWVP